MTHTNIKLTYLHSLIECAHLSAYNMTIWVRQICINALYLCYMDEHIRFEHNSKVTTLVVVEVVWVGCAPRTFCSRNPRNRSRPVTTATKASTQINETQYKSMKRNKNQCNS